MFGNNKHRVVFIDPKFSVISDYEIDPKRSPIPRIDEFVVFGEEYNKVLNVIHSPKDRVTWVVIEKFEVSKPEKTEEE